MRQVGLSALALFFLSGFFFLDSNNADPYREKEEPMNQQVVEEIIRHHRAAAFVINENETTQFDQHFSRELSEEELLLFRSIDHSMEPVIATQLHHTVSLQWSTIDVHYENRSNRWYITSVSEVQLD
ncbi:hypothetical protein [Shouchella lehensis]|uniref:DUF4440 domain-containing protein n=1 Tax=Shouchella lehensis G1 TaxID=1246626 RepID=A0A060LYX0_9BACI|nr:hypothetical protein [Shouchella lehensis]AIC96446.1 hypothetical protein BleG1_3899 [Shouchella lehensis G1]